MNYHAAIRTLDRLATEASTARPEPLFSDSESWYAYEALGDLADLLKMASERCRRLHNNALFQGKPY